jgi:NADPH-dependent ferric siderophore reductase
MAPGVPVIVLVEAADRRKGRHLPTAANARIRWLHRNGVATGTPSLLGPAGTWPSEAGGVIFPYDALHVDYELAAFV